MPLAKSSEQTVSQPTTEHAQGSTSNVNNFGFDGVPFEVYRYFNISPTEAKREDLRQVREVYDWANKDSKHYTESIYKLRQLETKLGQPYTGESRYSKMYNWVRVSKMVNSLEAERNRQANRIAQKRQEEIKRIKAEKDRQIAEIEKKRKTEEQAAKKAKENELRQFKRLQQAYS